eukprot:826115_1
MDTVIGKICKRMAHLIRQIVYNQLSSTLHQYKGFASLTQYAMDMMSVYCEGRTSITLNYNALNIANCAFFCNVLFKSTGTRVKWKEIHALFSNVESIEILYPPMVTTSLFQMFEEIQSIFRNSKLQEIVMHR